MNPSAIEVLATVLFALAVLHTFCVKKFAKWAHHYPEGSLPENLLHFLAETEIVFGVWAAALFMVVAAVNGSLTGAVEYIESLDFTEPKFVLAVMVVAATRPVVQLAERIIQETSSLIPLVSPNISFYFTALAFGPLLGSFITEPAAMTLLAMLLKQRYFDQGISKNLAYATLGLLFVNVSIGGTLTHFAAPPVLMVAGKWGWGMDVMLQKFGWRAGTQLRHQHDHCRDGLWSRTEATGSTRSQTPLHPALAHRNSRRLSRPGGPVFPSRGRVLRSPDDLPRTGDGDSRVPGPAEAQGRPARGLLPCRTRDIQLPAALVAGTAHWQYECDVALLRRHGTHGDHR
ncbi:MAG UNVERIFIED_CONTAM: putative Na+/H+ antiporter [Planctomycetaceae bacterium]|jgi:hypothetical protein